jgi:tRNA(adenine34) deaminase
MFKALALAHEAYDKGEVPVGAVIVKDDEIIGRGYNKVEGEKDPTAHAEILAVREAAANLGAWRMTDCTLYVTKEPCPMCAGALVMCRLGRLVFGVADNKLGYAVSLNNTVTDPRLNHIVEVRSGVLADEAAALLREFFRIRRS